MFFFEDPDHWERCFKSLKQNVASRLGIPDVDIQAELYKMLIYETGAMFKAHTEEVDPSVGSSLT